MATWCFMVGGFVANYANAVEGIVCIIAGNLAGTFLVTMAPALACQRYGPGRRRADAAPAAP